MPARKSNATCTSEQYKQWNYTHCDVVETSIDYEGHGGNGEEV